MNLEVKRSDRIGLDELAALLRGENDALRDELVLNASSERWATDYDLYRASLLLHGELTSSLLAAVLERVTIIPAEAAGEEKRPITSEELEELRKVLQ